MLSSSGRPKKRRFQEPSATPILHGPKENHTRPAIDPLFRSAAAAFGGHVIVVILTSYLDDGTAGLYAVKARGGYAIVHDPHDAQVPDMPASALEHVTVDQVLSLDEIGPVVTTLGASVRKGERSAAATERKPATPEWISAENRYVRGALDCKSYLAIPLSYRHSFPLAYCLSYKTKPLK